ncbi:hypothetical protein RCL1_002734 [Eukaryota sp. TZLM3-RCL]
MDDELVRLKRDYDDLQRTTSFEIQELKGELSRLVDENSSLTRQIESGQSAQVSSLNAEIIRLKNKVNTIHKGWTASTDKHKAEMEQLATQLATVRSKMVKFQQNSSDLQSRNSELEEENNQLKQSNLDLKTKEKSLTESRDHFKLKCRELSSSCENLEQIIVEKTDLIEQLDIKVEKFGENLASIDRLKEENQKLLSKISIIEAENLNLTEKFTMLSQETEQISHNLNMTIKDQSNNVERLSQKEQEIIDLQSILKNSEERSTEFERINQSLMSDLTSLLSDSEILQQKLTDSEATIAEKDEEVSRLSDLITSLNDQNSTLKFDLNSAETTLQEIMEKYEIEVKKSQELEQTITTNHDFVNRVGSENQDLIDRYNAIRRALVEKEEQLEVLTEIQTKLFTDLEAKIKTKRSKSPSKSTTFLENSEMPRVTHDVAVQSNPQEKTRTHSPEEVLLLKNVIEHLKSTMITLNSENAALSSQNKVLGIKIEVMNTCLLELYDVDSYRIAKLESELTKSHETIKILQEKLVLMEHQKQEKIGELQRQISLLTTQISELSKLFSISTIETPKHHDSPFNPPKSTVDLVSRLESTEVNRLASEIRNLQGILQNVSLERDQLLLKEKSLNKTISKLQEEISLVQRHADVRAESFLADQIHADKQFSIQSEQIISLKQQLIESLQEKEELESIFLTKISEVLNALANISNGQCSLGSVVTVLSRFEQKLKTARRTPSFGSSSPTTLTCSPSTPKSELRAQTEALGSVLTDTLLLLEDNKSEAQSQFLSLQNELETVLKDFSQLPAHLPKVKVYRKRLQEIRRHKVLRKAVDH